MDIIYLAVVAIFFGLTAGFLQLCERLMGGQR